MSTLKVDLSLVKKYSVPGPRYTSYPPATQFSAEVPWTDIREAIDANNRTSSDLSLYFHLPFCESLCWFCGCTTVITTQRNQSGVYLDHLKKEMDLAARFVHPGRRVVQLHFGGGTPTFLPPEDLRRLGGEIHSHFKIDPNVEAGVEVDPRRLSFDHLQALKEVGFNRASLGVQDDDPKVQTAVHRIQPFEMTSRVVGWLRELGFQSVSIDLIYGLPFQTVASFEKTLEDILSLGPDRLSVFSYAHVPWMKPAQKILESKSLPSPETKLELLKLTVERLTGAGYVFIGMDHFAKATDELSRAQANNSLQRNFQGYSTHGEADIYAFGMSAISQTNDAYWQNLKELPRYYEALAEDRIPYSKGYILTPDDKIRRRTIHRLMCDTYLDYAALSKQCGVDVSDYFRDEIASLDDLEADELLQRLPGRLALTGLGRLLIRNIAMRFDATLPATVERRFSRTI